jgi:cyanophycinase
MTGLLALVGGGEWQDGCSFDRELLDASGSDEVVVLATGSAYENPHKVIDRATAWFATLGASVREVKVYTRPDGLLSENVDAVRAAQFIYLAGTSAMHLRSVLKDSPLFDAIRDAWQDGAVLAGTNAGADVLCDPMVDSRGGAFTVGLGVVSNFAMIPRSNTWSHDKIHRTVELARSGVSLVAVPEGTALVRGDTGMWRAEGVGEVSVWIDGRVATVADLVQ